MRKTAFAAFGISGVGWRTCPSVRFSRENTNYDNAVAEADAGVVTSREQHSRAWAPAEPP